MAEVGNFMTLDVGDIHSILGVETGDIETVMGFEVPSGGWFGTRAVIFGGDGKTSDGSSVNSTDYILYKTMASDSNTSTFGQLANEGRELAKGSGSNIAKAVFGGGKKTVSGTATFGTNHIDIMTVGTLDSAEDFGNLANSSGKGGGDGASNGTLCFFNGGFDGGNNDDMEYLTFASGGGGTDAGNLEAVQNGHATSNGDSKYLILGGYLGSGYPITTVSQNSFHTTNPASDYGQVGALAMMDSAVVCSTTRVVVAAGYTSTSGWTRGDEIHYFTLDSGADSTDDGYTLHTPMLDTAGTSDGTRGEFYGGEHVSGLVHNEIQKVTIASLGNAADVGDLTSPDFGATTYNDAGGVHGSSAQTGT